MDNPVDKPEIKSKLSYLQSKFMKVLNSLTEEQFHKEVQDKDDGWTAIEVLRHIARSENKIVELMREIAKGEDGVDDSFDLTEENEAARQRNDTMEKEEIEDSRKK